MSKKKELENQKAGTQLKYDKGKYYNVEFKFRASEAALLVIDLQNDFFHDMGIHAKNGVDVRSLRSKIPYCVKLSDLCRELEIPMEERINTDRSSEPAMTAGFLLYWRQRKKVK